MIEASPSTRGRILAAFYLFLVAAGIVAQALISDGLVVRDDPVRTAANIVANKSLYRLGFTIFMIEMIAQLVVTVLFYELVKPVNHSVARISAALGLTGSGIKTLARVFYYAPLMLLGGASYLSALAPAQLAALSLFFVKINVQAANIAVIFFAFEVILRGWLLMKSDFLPRFLGVLTALSGLGWLTFLWPPLVPQVFTVVALLAIGTIVITAGYLILRGVDDVKWNESAAVSAGSRWR